MLANDKKYFLYHQHTPITVLKHTSFDQAWPVPLIDYNNQVTILSVRALQ